MPRPGPRPYECVRRAWHSDRHQPMRGSFIQEIFRVVNEVHKPATKKNKEWQEKLPVVVLKAEEIMYSKANTEVEYMDLNTLWDRTNHAIDTIIRRDESTETGEFLQPCIEAALNLGCTPQRASRSQRNVNPRSYLSPCSQEQPNSLSPGKVHAAIQANQTTNSLCLPNYSGFMKPTIMNSHLVFDPQNLACQTSRVSSNNFLLPSCDVPSSKKNQTMPLKSLHVPNFCSALPLYRGVCLEPQCNVAIYPSNNEPGILHDFFSCSDQAPVIVQRNGTDNHQDTDINCDLSLRLGYLSASSPKDKDMSKLKDAMHQRGSKYGTSLSSTISMSYSFESNSSKLSEHPSLDMIPRKRKAVYGHQHVEDIPFSWQSKLPCNYLTDRMKNPGS